jgi:hypothetical protein
MSTSAVWGGNGGGSFGRAGRAQNLLDRVGHREVDQQTGMAGVDPDVRDTGQTRAFLGRERESDDGATAAGGTDLAWRERGDR